MFYWTSEIAGKVKEILIINPQQCGPEPQIFAVGERRRRAGAGKGACFAPGGWRTRLLGRSRCFDEGRGAGRRTFRGTDRRGFGGDFGGDSGRSRGVEPSRRGPCLGKNFRSGDCRRARLRLSLSCGTIFALSFMRGVFFRRAANFGVMRRPACLNAKRCVFPRV